MSDIPTYVDSVLQEWHTIAFTAYDAQGQKFYENE